VSFFNHLSTWHERDKVDIYNQICLAREVINMTLKMINYPDMSLSMYLKCI